MIETRHKPKTKQQKQDMKSLKKERAVFTTVGATIREHRISTVTSSYDWLLISGGLPAKAKDQRLRYLACELIENGHYAKPGSFCRDNPSSYAATCHGVMSHMHKEWKRRRIAKDPKAMPLSRVESWKMFISEFSYDPENCCFF